MCKTSPDHLCLFSSSLTQSKEFGNEPLLMMMVGMTYQQLWYSYFQKRCNGGSLTSFTLLGNQMNYFRTQRGSMQVMLTRLVLPYSMSFRNLCNE